jgi:hypothetical protein
MERKIQQKRLLPPLDVLVGHEVVSFLNEEHPAVPVMRTKVRTKVRAVFDLCCILDKLRKMRDAVWGRADEINMITPRLSSAVEILNAALRDFRFFPCLMDAEQSYRVLWGAEFGGPAAIIGQILRMTEAGTIDRVRQCLCGKWFMAESNKKRVCSDACRFQKFKQENPDRFHQDRAEYMRGYRSNKVVKAKKRRTNAKKKTR